MPADAQDQEWVVSFEGVRIQQMIVFRSWSLQRKIQAMEDMAELVAHFRRMKIKSGDDKSNPR